MQIQSADENNSDEIANNKFQLQIAEQKMLCSMLQQYQSIQNHANPQQILNLFLQYYEWILQNYQHQPYKQVTALEFIIKVLFSRSDLRSNRDYTDLWLTYSKICIDQCEVLNYMYDNKIGITYYKFLLQMAKSCEKSLAYELANNYYSKCTQCEFDPIKESNELLAAENELQSFYSRMRNRLLQDFYNKNLGFHTAIQAYNELCQFDIQPRKVYQQSWNNVNLYRSHPQKGFIMRTGKDQFMFLAVETGQEKVDQKYNIYLATTYAYLCQYHGFKDKIDIHFEGPTTNDLFSKYEEQNSIVGLFKQPFISYITREVNQNNLAYYQLERTYMIRYKDFKMFDEEMSRFVRNQAIAGIQDHVQLQANKECLNSQQQKMNRDQNQNEVEQNQIIDDSIDYIQECQPLDVSCEIYNLQCMLPTQYNLNSRKDQNRNFEIEVMFDSDDDAEEDKLGLQAKSNNNNCNLASFESQASPIQNQLHRLSRDFLMSENKRLSLLGQLDVRAQNRYSNNTNFHQSIFKKPNEQIASQQESETNQNTPSLLQSLNESLL